MTRNKTFLYLLVWMLSGTAWAASVAFVPRELFQIPFGADKPALGTRIEGDRLLLPHDFSIDGLGRFYITDIGKNRIVRYSPAGAYEMSASYPATTRQVFAHGDENGNLWLLVAEPSRGVYYGVYDPRGKSLRTAAFSQYNRFRFHIGDDGRVRVILSSDKKPAEAHLYQFDTQTFLMKPDKSALPLEGHHQHTGADRSYRVDAVPESGEKDSDRVSRITPSSGGKAAEIRGRVIYMTETGDVYTRFSAQEIRVYGLDGQLKGSVHLSGPGTPASYVRFDAQGNIYQLDGIADAHDHYTDQMPGMRMIRWERR